MNPVSRKSWRWRTFGASLTGGLTCSRSAASRKRPVVLGALLGISLWANAHATGDAQDPSVVAEHWVRSHYQQPGSRVNAQAVPLDSRLHLDPCPVPLQVRAPAVDRVAPRVSIQVLCPASPGWTTRVMVNLQVYRTVLVASRPLARGDGVMPGDIHGEERDVARLGYGYFDRLDQLHARVLAHAVMRGSVLTPQAMGGRQLVRAGDQVQIVAQLAGIAVRASGTALGSGDTGGRIRVKNTASGRVVDALIDAPGVVEALP